MEQNYRITITGNLESGHSAEQAAIVLNKAFQIPVEKGRSLFQGKPTNFHKDLPKELADKICHYLRKAGAECVLAPVEGSSELTLEPIVVHAQEESELAKEAAPPPVPDAKLPSPPPPPQPQSVKRASNTVQPPPPNTPAKDSPTQADIGGGLMANHRPAAMDPGRRPPNPDMGNSPIAKKRVLVLSGLTLLIGVIAAAAAYFFLFNEEPPPATGSKPKLDPIVISVDNISQDPQFQEREVSLAQLKLNSLVQSIRVWMLQFGGGTDPTQVTIQRLETDIGLSKDDLADPWGTEIKYNPEVTGFSVLSAGPDKKFGTEDDIELKNSM